MDTHIATPPVPEEAGPTLSARLPGEPDPDAGSAARDGTGPLHAGDHLATSGPVPRRRRYALLTTASFVALALASASTFLVSPYNHVMPVPRMVSTAHDLAAKVGINLDRPLAPAASLADVPIVPPAGPMVRPKYVEPSRKEQLAELLRLHGDRALAEPVAPAPPSGSAAPLRETSPSGRLGTPMPTAPGGPAVAAAAASPQGPAPAPAGYVPHEPGAPPEPPSAGVATVGERPTHAPPQPPPVAPEGPASSPRAADVTKTVVASIEPPAQPAVALPEPSASRGSTTTRRREPVPAGTPIGHDVPPAAASDMGHPDPIKVASALRPAPLTAPDQVQVLELVTQMAAMVRDLRAQDASLRSDFAKTSADTGKRLDDFERRVVLAEARNAVASAATAPSSVAVDGAAAVHPVAPAAPVPVTPLAAALHADGNGNGIAKRYRVQAASPGLALLAEIDRGGGDGAQIQASVGDTIPGYGRVKSVSQHGTTWVVTTEHGNID
jgi:hypothetical protein